ncbi:Hypothetical predicted protein [Mytilus galloprovincialis]|uniref:Uncharacterized protein n=1 Tax=Mytilus galloprovincialis TaxID=29158 RepID=A0A8B6EBY8_MYTGA|nr:Hypothetical predicted protein [Mytilus galloprovincialis]
MADSDRKTLATVWGEFSQSTGFHGVNKLANGNKLRSLFWLCSFLACAVYLTYVMIQELGNYYNYPTYTTLEVERHSEIEFPAVTICNLNSLSKSLVLNDSRVDNYYLSIGPREIFDMHNRFNWSDPFYEQNGFSETEL